MLWNKYCLEDEVRINNPINFFSYLSPSTGKLSCLDICLSSLNMASIIEMRAATDIDSDHRTIKIIVQVEPEIYKIKILQKYICSNKEELYKFKCKLSRQNRICGTKTMTVEEGNKQLAENIIIAAENNIKKSRITNRVRRCTPWWNIECSKAVAKLRRTRRILERTPTADNLRIYKKKTLDAKEICRKSKKKHSFQEYVGSLRYDTPTKEVCKKIEL